MIRASSFPILLGIALYERQTYRQDPLMEQFERWTDKWMGGFPRLIRNVGESRPDFSDTPRPLLISAVISLPAGLESLAGASRDLDIIFEVEQEVGDYYQ